MSSNAARTDAGGNRSHLVLGVTSATWALATAAVALRLWVRLRMVRSVTLDDYLIVLAWLLAFAVSFTISYGTHVGLGLHDADINPGDRQSLKTCEYVFTVLYVRKLCPRNRASEARTGERGNNGPPGNNSFLFLLAGCLLCES